MKQYQRMQRSEACYVRVFKKVPPIPTPRGWTLRETRTFLNPMFIYLHFTLFGLLAAFWYVADFSFLEKEIALLGFQGINYPLLWFFFFYLTVSYHLTKKYHKHSGLKQYEFIILQFWRSEIQNRSHWANIKVSVGLQSFLEARGENPFLCCFQLLKAAHLPWLVASSVFKTSKFSFLCPFCRSQISLWLLLSPFTLEDSWDYIGPAR